MNRSKIIQRNLIDNLQPMKKIFLQILGLLVLSYSSYSQDVIIPAIQGFDVLRENISHGKIDTISYQSTTVGNKRKAIIYAPPGYSKNKKYPVLYLLHGIGGDEKEWLNGGNPQIILDNLIASKKAAPMLVVMPDANMGVPGFDESGLKKFEQELSTMIIPFVEKNYRVKTDAISRALAGLSMGGIHTLYTGIKHSDKFSYIGVFSSGWIMPNQNEIANNQYTFLKENANQINNRVKQFWISMGGKEDIAYKNCQLMLAKFNEMKINYAYSEYPGGHTWQVWRNNLYNFAQVLFK
jgi:enterochelin esterase-like enzyme